MANDLEEIGKKIPHPHGKVALVIVGLVLAFVAYHIFSRRSSVAAPTSRGVPTGAAFGTLDQTSPSIIPSPVIATQSSSPPSSATSMPDFGGLVQSLQSYQSLISTLQGLGGTANNAVSAPAPPTFATGSGYTPPSTTSDYSAFGPFANFIAQYGYANTLHRAPDQPGLLFWENQTQNAVDSGVSPQTAENQTILQIAASPEAKLKSGQPSTKAP